MLGEAHIIHPLAGQGFAWLCAMAHNWPKRFMAALRFGF